MSLKLPHLRDITSFRHDAMNTEEHLHGVMPKTSYFLEEYQEIEEMIGGLLKQLAFLQHYPPESVGLRGRLIFLLILYTAVQPAIAVILNWQHWTFNLRVSAIDNLIFSFGVICLSVDIFLMPGKTQLLLKIIKSRYKLYAIDPESEIASEKIELVREKTLEGYRKVKVTVIILKCLSFSYLLIPIIGVSSYVLQLNTVENLALPFLFYSPLSQSLEVTSFYEYLLLSLIESFYIYYTASLAIAIFITQFLSLNNILVEMKLFHLNTREIDVLFENSKTNGIGEGKLKSSTLLAMRLITKHHQTIFRKVKQLNDGMIFRMFSVNTYMGLQICLGIFIFVKGEFLYKLKYGLVVVTTIMTEYLFSENGQLLENEGEQLRMALYYCNWIDKPTWFTSTLKILMTRNNNPPIVSLFNIINLNRNNMTVVMRGVYSYFNLLNKLSS